MGNLQRRGCLPDGELCLLQLRRRSPHHAPGYFGLLLSSSGGPSAYSDDQHNIVKLTDNTGTVVESYDYRDYGQPEFYSPPANPGQATGEQLDVAESPFGNPYLFTGRRWDEELGYYYFRNRYMDPSLGRFVSRDPIGLWGDGANLGNGYTYAASNPWSLVDPFGLDGGNQEEVDSRSRGEVVAGFGYYYPDPNSSGYSPEMGQRLHEAAMGNLNDQVKWVAEGLSYIPGPTGVAGDVILYVWTGDGWALLPGVVGSVGGDVAGAIRRLNRAELVAAAQKRGVGVTGKVLCFPPGTLVLMADGSTKPIEEVTKGDRVLADNPRDNDTAASFEVTEVHHNYTLRLINVSIDHDGDGDSDGVFRATGEHPIWTQNEGWKDAEDLAPGDVLQDEAQKSVLVTRVWKEITESRTHNLTVDSVNTFFVVVDGTPILVHNTPNDIVPYSQKKQPECKSPWSNECLARSKYERRRGCKRQSCL